MTSLKDFAKSVGVDLTAIPLKEPESPTTPTGSTEQKRQGRHRRAWIETYQDDEVNNKKDQELNTKEPINDELISNQLVTNKEPISNQLVTTISNQLVTNKEPISNQLVTKEELSNVKKNTISNQLVTELVTTISNQLVTTQSLVSRSTGHQRTILFYIVEDCIYRGDLVSGFITNETLRKIANTTSHTVKTAIQRIIKKGLVKRLAGQRGQGGFSSFSITTEVRDAVLKEKRNPSKSKQLVTNKEPISNQLVSELVTKAPSSSSSLKDLKTTTTRELGDDWNLDIDEYSKFGFTSLQLRQVAFETEIKPEELKESLDHFKFDFENKNLPAMKKDEISFLMHCLRKNGVYESVSLIEERSKAIEELSAQSRAAKKKLLEAKFEAWETMLTIDEKLIIEKKLPVHLVAPFRSFGIENKEVRNWLYDHFVTSVSEAN